MQANLASKRDRLLFREKIAGWQEAYIVRLNRKYTELLRCDGSEAEKFWELYKLYAWINAASVCRRKCATRRFSLTFAAWSMKGQSVMTISMDSVKNCMKM